jgi:potassium voltage-gated channel Shab-related subfamily B protein 2
MTITPKSPDEPEGGKLGSAATDYVDNTPEIRQATSKHKNPSLFAGRLKRAALDDDVDDVWLEAIRLSKLRIWIFLDDPDSSRLAYLTSCGILLLILLSSVTFCLETMHDFEDVPERIFIFFIIECICIAAFTAEYVLKLLCAPRTVEFLVSPLNLVDLISILPFYLEQAVSGGGLSGTRIFRTVRLVRVFRVLKLGGRFGKIQVVANSMAESMDMLAMMMFLLTLTVIVFSALIFFAERGVFYEDSNLYSRKTDITCDASALAGTVLLLEDGKTLVAGCGVPATLCPLRPVYPAP